MTSITIHPIAYVQNSRRDMRDDHWGGVLSRITLGPDVPPEALDGIEQFSHVEIVFHFHKLDDVSIARNASTSHPRNNPAWPQVGIFAQRKKRRPNGLGLTIARVEKREGPNLFVSELDAEDGSPVFDIKPVMREFLPQAEVVQPTWCAELMKTYWSFPGE